MSAHLNPNLTPYQQRVLAMVLAGKDNAAIAAALHTTNHAIACTVWKICRRHGLKGERALLSRLLTAQR